MSTLSVVRRWLFAVLALGVAGTGTELLLIEHYEDPLQFVPLATIAIAARDRVARRRRRSAERSRAPGHDGAVSIRRGRRHVVSFSRRSGVPAGDRPGTEPLEIFSKVMRAKAPPVLASGVMVQLGLLGLVYAYRHPALNTELLLKEDEMIRKHSFALAVALAARDIGDDDPSAQVGKGLLDPNVAAEKELAGCRT